MQSGLPPYDVGNWSLALPPNVEGWTRRVPED
jgi:hypothetical protein